MGTRMHLLLGRMGFNAACSGDLRYAFATRGR
jgi:hypothetical protein